MIHGAQAPQDKLRMLEGPITRSNAKKLQQVLNIHCQAYMSKVKTDFDYPSLEAMEEDEMHFNLWQVHLEEEY